MSQASKGILLHWSQYKIFVQSQDIYIYIYIYIKFILYDHRVTVQAIRSSWTSSSAAIN